MNEKTYNRSKTTQIINPATIPVVTHVDTFGESKVRINTNNYEVRFGDIEDVVSSFKRFDFPVISFDSETKYNEFLHLIPEQFHDSILTKKNNNLTFDIVIRPDKLVEVAPHFMGKNAPQEIIQKLGESLIKIRDLKGNNNEKKMIIEAMSDIWTLFKDSEKSTEIDQNAYYHELNHAVLAARDKEKIAKLIVSKKMKRILSNKEPNKVEKEIQNKHFLFKSVIEAIAIAHELLATHNIDHPNPEILKKKVGYRMAKLLQELNTEIPITALVNISDSHMLETTFSTIRGGSISGLMDQHSVGSIMLLLCNDAENNSIVAQNDVSKLFNYGTETSKTEILLQRIISVLNSDDEKIIEIIRSNYNNLHQILDQLSEEIKQSLSLKESILRAFSGLFK